MQDDKSGAGYGNHGGDQDADDKGHDGARSEDYKAEDKSDPNPATKSDEGAAKQ